MTEHVMIKRGVLTLKFLLNVNTVTVSIDCTSKHLLLWCMWNTILFMLEYSKVTILEKIWKVLLNTLYIDMTSVFCKPGLYVGAPWLHTRWYGALWLQEPAAEHDKYQAAVSPFSQTFLTLDKILLLVPDGPENKLRMLKWTFFTWFMISVF